jgi:hypothetical protein
VVGNGVAGLFQLPLAEFTAARNALAAQLKKSGRADEAARVKGLQMPSVSAWTVNQLFWRHRKLFDRLMASGQQFRDAQAAQLAGKSADLRKALEARRTALAELAQVAGTLLKSGDHQPSPDMMRRVTTTLEALSTLANVANAPQAGHLVDDVDPPGFEALAALVPTLGGAKGREGAGSVLRFEPRTKPARPRKTDKEPDAREREQARQAQEAERRAARQRTERELREAQRAAEAAEAALKKAAARLKDAERAKAALEQQLEKADAELTAARQQARRASAEAEEAAQAVTEAERTMEGLR